MTILVVNCGSSSIKVQAIAADGARHAASGPGPPRRLLRATVERLGPAARVTLEAPGGPSHRATEPVADYAAGVRRIVDWARAAGVMAEVDAVGHRVVHGGGRFSAPALIDPDVLGAIEALGTLAPLHNAPSLAGIRACREVLGPEVPMVAVFDTAFHATLPEPAFRYAIPHDLATRHGIRRYGFHGTAFRSVVERYAALAGRAPEAATIVALHLGAGCSAAAIRGGRSVDTSMGLTPLEGLVMATRSGDLDPAVVGHLARAEGVDVAEVERWLNECSGLLGLSGASGDMRALLETEGDDPRARLAVDVFCYRARKYAGAYLAALGGADALVFSGGIGEGSPEIRERIAGGLGWAGLTLDAGRNAAAVGREGRISADRARLAAFVVTVDEESVIARDTLACVAEARTGRRP